MDPGSSPITDLGTFEYPLDTYHIKRPANAFMLFRAAYDRAIRNGGILLSNSEISRRASKAWRASPENVHERYKREAKELKDFHASMNPGYAYNPRPEADIPRRMTPEKLKQCAKIMDKVVAMNLAGIWADPTKTPWQKEAEAKKKNNPTKFPPGKNPKDYTYADAGYNFPGADTTLLIHPKLWDLIYKPFIHEHKVEPAKPDTDSEDVDTDIDALFEDGSSEDESEGNSEAQ